jgi:hypothetical protein
MMLEGLEVPHIDSLAKARLHKVLGVFFEQSNIRFGGTRCEIKCTDSDIRVDSSHEFQKPSLGYPELICNGVDGGCMRRCMRRCIGRCSGRCTGRCRRRLMVRPLSFGELFGCVFGQIC